VLACEEIDGEGNFAISVEVPAGAVEMVGVGVGEGDAFPAEALALPAKAVGVDGENVVKAGEEDEAGGGCGEGLGDGAEGKMDAVLGGKRIDEIGVASGNGEEAIRVRAGKDAGGEREAAEAEGAGGEEVGGGFGFYVEQKSAAAHGILFAGYVLRVDVLARGSDERRCGEDARGPGLREGLGTHAKCSHP